VGYWLHWNGANQLHRLLAMRAVWIALGHPPKIADCISRTIKGFYLAPPEFPKRTRSWLSRAVTLFLRDGRLSLF
jgi:hypothetical protein